MGSSPGPRLYLLSPLCGARGGAREGLLATATTVRPTTATSATDWSFLGSRFADLAVVGQVYKHSIFMCVGENER